MASSKRAVRQEDTNLTKLREIGARLENKTCFDCGQKGPTYVNTTIGSFVCTHCSGLLRGLTPPHRVKSISMASFTPEELDNLSKHGNHFCRGVWLGSYDEKLGYPDFKDEHKVRDFMIAKYEKKKYYVDPSIVERLEKTSPKSGAKPLASLVPQVSPLNVRGTNSTPSASAFDAWKTTPKSNADSGGVKPKFDPFGSLPNTPTHSAISQPNFADFDNNPVFQTAGSKSGALQPMTSMSASSVCPPPSSAAGAVATAAGIFGSPPIANTAASSNSTTAAAAATPPKKEAFGPDRYAALADLDELFKQTSVSPPEPPKPEPQTHAWMKPGGGFQQQHHHQQQPNGGFQQSNGVVHNPFQHPSGANSAGPAPAKSTNPFVANGGNAELVDSFAWAQQPQQQQQQQQAQLTSAPIAAQNNWANFNNVPTMAPQVAPMANPWGGAMQPHQQHQSGVPLSMSVPMAMSSGSQLGAGSGGGFGNSQTVFGNPWNASGFATGGGSFMGSTPNPFAMEQRLTTGTTAPTTSKNNPFL